MKGVFTAAGQINDIENGVFFLNLFKFEVSEPQFDVAIQVQIRRQQSQSQIMASFPQGTVFSRTSYLCLLI